MSLDIWLEMDTGNGSSLSTDSLNVTYNVFRMYERAGVRDALKGSDGRAAREVADIFARGADAMKADPGTYEAMNPANGWGDYEGAVEFLEQLADLCRLHPNAVIRTSQ